MNKTGYVTGFACLFLTFFLWGSVYVAGKLGSAELSPFLIAALRCGVAAPLLLLMARKHLGTRIDPADRKYFLAVEALMKIVYLYHCFLFHHSFLIT